MIIMSFQIKSTGGRVSDAISEDTAGPEAVGGSADEDNARRLSFPLTCLLLLLLRCVRVPRECVGWMTNSEDTPQWETARRLLWSTNTSACLDLYRLRAENCRDDFFI